MNWSEWIVVHEMPIRLGCFVSIFLVMATGELYAPCRDRIYSRLRRWPHNLGLVFCNTLLLRLLFPLSLAALLYSGQADRTGLLALSGLPLWASTMLAIVLLDLLVYGQHVLFHKVPLLWRLHKVHHADPDFDLTTGSRFHPVEIILSLLLKMSVAVLLGVPAVAAVLFEALLNGSAMFNHANVRLPKSLDQYVRFVFVTPDMHRVHHSQIPAETNSNYGFALSCWDRLFSTYCPEAQDGQQGLKIGLSSITDPRQAVNLSGMLLLPFVSAWRSSEGKGKKPL